MSNGTRDHEPSQRHPNETASAERREAAALDEKTKEAYFNWLEDHGINRVRDAVFCNSLDEDDKRYMSAEKVKKLFVSSVSAFGQFYKDTDPVKLMQLYQAVEQVSPENWLVHATAIAKEFEGEVTVDIKGVTEESYRLNKQEKKPLPPDAPNVLVYTATVNAGRRTFLRDYTFAISRELDAELKDPEKGAENQQKFSQAFKEIVEDNQGDLGCQAVRYDKKLGTIVYWVDNIKFGQPFETVKAVVQDVVKDAAAVEECLKYRKSFPVVRYPQNFDEEYTLPGSRMAINMAEESFVKDNKAAIAKQAYARDVLRRFENISNEDLMYLQQHGEELLEKYEEYKTTRADKKFYKLPPEEKKKINDAVNVFERVGLNFGEPSQVEIAAAYALERRFHGQQPPELPDGLRADAKKYFELLQEGLSELDVQDLDSLTSGWSDGERARLFRMVLDHFARWQEFNRILGVVEDMEEEGLPQIDEMEKYRQAVAGTLELARLKERNPGFKEPAVRKDFAFRQLKGFVNVDLPQNLPNLDRLQPALVAKAGSKEVALKVPIYRERKDESGKVDRFTFYLPLGPSATMEGSQAADVQNHFVEYFADYKTFNPYITVDSSSAEPKIHFQMIRNGKTEAEVLSLNEIRQSLNFADRTLVGLLAENYLARRDSPKASKGEAKEITDGEKDAIKKFNNLICHAAFPSVTERLLAKLFAKELRPAPAPLLRRGTQAGQPKAEGPKVLQAEFVEEEQAPSSADVASSFEADKISDEILLQDVGMKAAHDFIKQKVRDSFKGEQATPEELDQLADLVWKIKRRKIINELDYASRYPKLLE